MSQLSRAGRSLVAVAAFALVLTACNPGYSTADNPVGTWSESTDPGAPTLTLDQDGQLSGFDGCNHLTGGWEPTDQGVNFKQLASTNMACPGVDVWLGQAAAAKISFNTMTVVDIDGITIGTLERTDTNPPAS